MGEQKTITIVLPCDMYVLQRSPQGGQRLYRPSSEGLAQGNVVTVGKVRGMLWNHGVYLAVSILPDETHYLLVGDFNDQLFRLSQEYDAGAKKFHEAKTATDRQVAKLGLSAIVASAEHLLERFKSR